MLTPLPFDHDDAMVDQTLQDGRARHRVYTPDHVAVVLGRGSKPEVELRTAAIVADAVTVYRRRGGGCSVVLDPGNLIISLALPVPGLGAIKSSFASISLLLCRLLAACGVPDVKQRGVSDLVVDDRKLGGSCVHRLRDLLYYSATLLVEPDLELLERYLHHPPREPDYRDRRGHRDFVTTLREQGLPAPLPTLRDQLNSLLDNNLQDLTKRIYAARIV